ncbi:MAG TPA: hypothetical protein VJA28_01650 [Patescibacteria group bacterium]|nr:hypothetical protein [Patescibacteria group bacterium]
MADLAHAAFFLYLAAVALFLPRVDRYLRQGYHPGNLTIPQLLGLLLAGGFLLSAARYVLRAVTGW